MSFHRPHPPYDPPDWAFEQYLGGEMPAPPLGDWVKMLAPYATPGNPEAFVDETVPANLLNRARAGYYGHMTHIDHQINRFLETLQEYSLRENTIILFTSDHGEMIGDHTLYRKGYAYEGSARVPLILFAPPEWGILPGSVHHQVVELRDIMPTLLECAGLPIPESLEGCSFLPLAQGQKPAWRTTLHGEHTIFGQSMQWLTDGHKKYVWYSGGGQEQFFNLDADPQECHDLAGDPANTDQLNRWRQRLIAELQGREEGFTDGEHLIPGRLVKPVLSHRDLP